jgi:hypothetical protein
MRKISVTELCELYNETGSWREVAKLKEISPEHLSTLKKKHIKMVAVLKPWEPKS